MLYRIYPAIAMAMLLLACEPQDNSEAKAQLIDERVAEKVERLRNSKADRCRTELYTQANTIVDSILIARAKVSKDTITKPMKVSRPDLPDAFLLEDTFAIHPLLPEVDTLNADTLTNEDIE
ncbi:MAG: hypothetical protein AAGI23_17435 [Bacteroidota bacterium]